MSMRGRARTDASVATSLAIVETAARRGHDYIENAGNFSFRCRLESLGPETAQCRPEYAEPGLLRLMLRKLSISE
jgi:hypothetical protein